MEFQILDWIQTLRTPIMDQLMCFITMRGTADLYGFCLQLFCC